MKRLKRILSRLLSLTLLLSMTVPAAFAAEPSVSSADGWYYTVSDGEATLVAASDAAKSAAVILLPARIAGLPVTAVGSGTSAVLTNASGWVLLPEGVETISSSAFYDLNRAPGWSFPASLTQVADNATASCGGTFYAGLSDAAAAYAAKAGNPVDTSAMAQLTVSAGEHGSVYPNGTYHLPAALTAAKLTVSCSITAEQGYAIAALTVNGQPVPEAAGQNTYAADLPVAAGTVQVTFAADPDDPRTETDPAASYQAPALLEAAVAPGAKLPDDVYAYAPDTDGEGTNKYSSTMGVMTGTYYAAGGILYEMTHISQNVCYRSKAEVINAMYEQEGLVYGADYDLIRLFNYVHSYANGPRPGNFRMNCCYLYKAVGSSAAGLTSNAAYERAYEHIGEDGAYNAIQGDVATVMVQAGAPVTIDSLKSQNNTIPYGPSEAANFYGLGSAVLVDGGDSAAKGSYLGVIRDVIDSSTASLTLNDPTIVGAENVLFAVAGGVAHLNGGRYFGTSSGGHGLYVAQGGQITLNANDAIVDPEAGVITEDYAALVRDVLDERPATDLGTAEAAQLTEDWNAYAQPVFAADVDDDIAILVTADETGTALTTDTGGGTIVANRLSATTYGRGCAGVYSIGGDESLVYVFNSALHSNADSALCSASAGYIFAFNTELTGVAGIKTRMGGSGEKSGVTVYNSKVVSTFEPDHYDFYHLATDQDTWDDAAQFADWSWADDKSLVNAPMLNLFVNKTSYAFGQDISTEQSYWFQDKNTAPQTGEAIAPILATGGAEIRSYSNYYVNQNYLDHADEGAKNYLIAADNGGEAKISFYDQNDQTKWDLTGQNSETTQLNGDLYIAATITMTGPDAGNGPSSADVHFYNSQWTGKVEGYLRNADLSFDADSRWTVTGSTGVGNLTLADADCITAETPVTVKVYGTLTIDGQPVTENVTLGNVTFQVGVRSVYFTDLETQSAWCAPYADDLAKEGFIPSGLLEPMALTTRAQFIQALYHAAGTPETTGSAAFTDVSPDAAYYNAVIWAAETGIASGTSATTFSPDAALTREQAMTFLFRAFDALNIDAAQLQPADLSAFSDSAGLSVWARESASALAGLEAVSGRPGGCLEAKASVRNCEMVTLLSKTLEHKKASGGMMPPGFDPSMMGGGEGGTPPPPPGA